MLLQYIERLPPQQPYYAIRRINLYDGKYKEAANPDYSPHLVSNRVRYSGAVHEQVQPRKPHGRIDFPIIHNHVGMWKYRSGRSEEHTSELQSQSNLVCRLLLE